VARAEGERGPEIGWLQRASWPCGAVQVIPGALALVCGVAIGYLVALAQLEHFLR